MKTLELYILSNEDLSIKSVCQPCSYNINLDEETNGKSTFILPALNFAKKGYYAVLNGLYQQFIFKIDDVFANKNEKTTSVTMIDISNIFDRKVIAKNLDTMTSSSLEDFIGNTILENFVNSDDIILNLNYIDLYIHSHTLVSEPTNEENGLYNFHTFLINCRQNKNIYCDFKFENGRMRIDIKNKVENMVLIDTTVKEVTNYNKIYEVDPITKVQVYIREDGTEYNLYLRTDRTTTTDKDDINRAKGRTETISVETLDKANEEALNIIRGNTYKHLVEFQISKKSKLVDVTQLKIGRLTKIKTDDDVYDSYISAISINDNDNFISYKSGNLRISLLDKLKQEKKEGIGNKLDISGGILKGPLNVLGEISKNGVPIESGASGDTVPIGAGMWYPSDIIPDNWLLCNGQAVSRTTYNLLFSIIGTTHGAGDGSTTFNLPNIKGRTIVGKTTTAEDSDFDTLGEIRGNKNTILTQDNLPARTIVRVNLNTAVDSAQNVSIVNGWRNVCLQDASNNSPSNNFKYEQPINNLQPSITENYIIKAKYSEGILPQTGLVLDGFGNTSAVNAGSANNDNYLYTNKADKINMSKYIIHRGPIFGIGGDAAKSFDKNNWVDLTGGDIYNPRLFGVAQIPVPTGYTRYVRAYAVYSDNANTGTYGLIVKTMNSGLDRNYFRFPVTWGDSSARRDAYSEAFIPISSLFNGHTRFYAAVPGEAQTGAIGKLYYLELVYYDVPNGIVPV
jgi:microcystin-dependent protein